MSQRERHRDGCEQRFLKEFHSLLQTFENEYEVAPGVVVQRTGGHTPGHSVVRLASGGDRLMFAGDLVFQVGFEHPDWYNGFEASSTPDDARYRLRKQIVEPVFGQIKQARGFRQFAGVEKVGAEWAMICSAHNLLELAKSA